MKTLVMAIALMAPLAHAASPDVSTMLKNADAFRGGGQQQIDTLVEVTKPDGSLDKERRYTVLTGPERRSLVVMQSPSEKGQKVLMLGDDFWLVMPGSQRPMRITPTQKLLGDASTGDVATQSWSDDYDGDLVGEERCEAAACWHLRLKAKRRGVSYQRIELWLGKTRHEPLTAELYVQSEKLAKKARFVMDKNQVTEMVLQDSLGSHKLTHLRYLARKGRQVPESWFNPMFLARSPVLE